MQAEMSLQDILAQSKEITSKTTSIVLQNEERRRSFISMQDRVVDLVELLEEQKKEQDVALRAIQLIGNASDDTIDNTLKQITSVINRSLAILFPTDRRVVHIGKYMYRDKHLHYELELETGARAIKRSFDMSGTGLAQVVSFLFVVSFIDVIKARRLVVLDEVLNGLHPSAKELIREIIMALSPRFQFIIVEYGLDIGLQLEVEKIGEQAYVRSYEPEYQKGYFDDISKRTALSGLKHLKDFTDTESTM